MRKFTLLICLCLVQFAFAQRKGYWQQKVDYKIDVDMKEKAYQYDGKMQLKYTNNSGQSLNKVYFHLYFNAFQPGSMMDNRLQNIPDPDKRMATNVGTKENPKVYGKRENENSEMGVRKSIQIANCSQQYVTRNLQSEVCYLLSAICNLQTAV